LPSIYGAPYINRNPNLMPPVISRLPDQTPQMSSVIGRPLYSPFDSQFINYRNKPFNYYSSPYLNTMKRLVETPVQGYDPTFTTNSYFRDRQPAAASYVDTVNLSSRPVRYSYIGRNDI
jgi:hypothetical protein